MQEDQRHTQMSEVRRKAQLYDEIVAFNAGQGGISMKAGVGHGGALAVTNEAIWPASHPVPVSSCSASRGSAVHRADPHAHVAEQDAADVHQQTVDSGSSESMKDVSDLALDLGELGIAGRAGGDNAHIAQGYMRPTATNCGPGGTNGSFVRPPSLAPHPPRPPLVGRDLPGFGHGNTEEMLRCKLQGILESDAVQQQHIERLYQERKQLVESHLLIARKFDEHKASVIRATTDALGVFRAETMACMPHGLFEDAGDSCPGTNGHRVNNTPVLCAPTAGFADRGAAEGSQRGPVRQAQATALDAAGTQCSPLLPSSLLAWSQQGTACQGTIAPSTPRLQMPTGEWLQHAGSLGAGSSKQMLGQAGHATEGSTCTGTIPAFPATRTPTVTLAAARASAAVDHPPSAHRIASEGPDGMAESTQISNMSETPAPRGVRGVICAQQRNVMMSRVGQHNGEFVVGVLRLAVTNAVSLRAQGTSLGERCLHGPWEGQYLLAGVIDGLRKGAWDCVLSRLDFGGRWEQVKLCLDSTTLDWRDVQYWVDALDPKLRPCNLRRIGRLLSLLWAMHASGSLDALCDAGTDGSLKLKAWVKDYVKVMPCVMWSHVYGMFNPMERGVWLDHLQATSKRLAKTLVQMFGKTGRLPRPGADGGMPAGQHLEHLLQIPEE